ncbi:Heat shock protein HslJ [Pseudarcicella hirudinis]|uniref:Heat shock protein HslJ n=1 Tax=Pseudarcicella hirudinis TaxID=1079859 RepID=A0A1I5U890_9BACT|nr:DUF4377 domain-containing protein [Pseudarcicella hirudinis]SFP91521.1 Heat shock protein HslJ [Pseudarcicella hirudinis]
MKIKLLLFLFTAFSLQAQLKGKTDNSLISPYKKLIVADHQADCSAGAGKMKCLLVKSSPEKKWENFYNSIDGFEYQPGFQYELLVTVSKVVNPPADASSLKYTLRDIISKIPGKKVSKKPVLSESFSVSSKNITWVLTDFISKGEPVENKEPEPNITFDFAQKRISGKGVCNRYFGKLIDQKKNKITLDGIGSTKMMCPNLDKEQIFFNLLALVTSYQLKGDRLYLYRNEELILAFKQNK